MAAARLRRQAEQEKVMKKVLIPTKLDKAAVEILKNNGNYTVVQEETKDLKGFVQQHPDAYALIVRSEPVTAEIIDALPSLKVIIRAGAGYNTIDTRYARKKNIDVMNTPGANSNAVAEEVIALMLADARFVVPADASCRTGQWEKTAFMGRELGGKTIGIVGLGNIGRLVAKRLSGFDVKLLGYDPMISRERAAEMDVEMVGLETIFAQADYVSLHVPENDETRKMVGAELLGLMKKGATIVNCARAGIIDEAALRQAKTEKGLRFLNDVYPKDEPGVKSVADIADIMLPHLGASTREANLKAATRAAEQLIEFDEKGVTSYIVNRDIPEGLDPAYCELATTLARLCRALLGKDAKISALATSFYGTLQPFGAWLLAPVAAGLLDEVDRAMDSKAVQSALKERGIEYRDRVSDPKKGYDNSITIDLTGTLDASQLRHVSVRGTVAESTLMISRINDFDKLYFEPKGYTVLFSYMDRPGVVGTVGARLAESQINIEDIRHCHNIASDQSMVLMRVNKPVPDALVRKISAEIKALSAISLEL
jgi:D-3-phosphoglycerate dehydrogenase